MVLERSSHILVNTCYTVGVRSAVPREAAKMLPRGTSSVKGEGHELVGCRIIFGLP